MFFSARFCGTVCAQGADSSITNISLIRTLVAEAGGKLLTNGTLRAGDTVRLTVRSDGKTSWMVRQALIAGVQNRVSVAADDSSAPRGAEVLEITPAIAVRYGDPVRANLLGPTHAARLVSVDLSCAANRAGVTNAVTVSASSSDTVEIGRVGELEQGAAEFTTGPANSSGGILDLIAKPLVIIGSVGTIIFLLFHVRS